MTKLKFRNVLIIALAFSLSILASSTPSNAYAIAGSGPTVEMTAEALADNYADSMYPEFGSAYGMRPVLYVGNSYDRAQNRSGPARLYITFDLSRIPQHAHVVSAEMSLYQMYAPASSQILEVHMTQSAWNETIMNWNTQPDVDPTVVSRTEAPPEKDVRVSWDITSAVQTWVNGEAPNYGVMIRIQNERTGVANQASGFYSREYPKEDLKPKLRVLCQNNPPFTYLLTVHVSGLPAEFSSAVSADDAVRISVSGGRAANFLFESGTEHVISADEYVDAQESVRYHAEIHSTLVTTDAEYTITYKPQFHITVRSEPAGLIEKEWADWYGLGASIQTPLARLVADEGPDMKIVFDGWYINNAKQPSNPVGFAVEAPATVAARYKTLYKVLVSSTLGNVSGSGWHPAGSRVEISVTPSYVPADGILGFLGLGMTFDHWRGSFDDTSPTFSITVNGPIEAAAVWREDRSRLVLISAATVVLVLILAVFRSRAKRSRPRGSTAQNLSDRTRSRKT